MQSSNVVLECVFLQTAHSLMQRLCRSQWWSYESPTSVVRIAIPCRAGSGGLVSQGSHFARTAAASHRHPTSFAGEAQGQAQGRQERGVPQVTYITQGTGTITCSMSLRRSGRQGGYLKHKHSLREDTLMHFTALVVQWAV